MITIETERRRPSETLRGRLHDTPLILVGKMWGGLVDWARIQLLKTDPPLANPEDMNIPRCVETADEAIRLIREHHTRWRQK